MIAVEIVFGLFMVAFLLYVGWYALTYDRRARREAKLALDARVREADRAINQITFAAVRQMSEIVAQSRHRHPGSGD